jgi:hypothetical protein
VTEHTGTTEAAADATTELALRRRRIPLDFRTIAANVASTLLPREPCVAEVADRLESIFALECAHEEEELKDAYRPLRPADDEPEPDPESEDAAERDAYDAEMWSHFLALLARSLTRANYVRLSRADLQAAAERQSLPGLRVRVDFSAYDRLELFVRGDGEQIREYRRWTSPWRKRELRVPTHERIVLMARLRSEPGLHLKLFRDIPEHDVEALLPGTKFKMRLFDHFKISGAGGTAIVSFLLRASKPALFLPKVLLPFFYPIVIVGACFYAAKTAWGYFKAKDSYRSRLMNELFFQMLDGDVGVITRVVDEAEEEEAKECFLAWAALRRHGPLSDEALRGRVEHYLQLAHGHSVAFDLEDAVGKLLRVGIGRRRSADGKLEGVPGGVAAVRLKTQQVMRAAARR